MNNIIENSTIKFENGRVHESLEIMKEAAQWLIDRNQKLWDLNEFEEEAILAKFNRDNIYLYSMGNEPVASLILLWEDKLFWPNINKDESAFVHKLSIRRRFAGTGLVKNIFKCIEELCKTKNINFIRLDCVGDRPKLCKIYEDLGFQLVNRRMIGIYDTSFYEKKMLKN